MKETSRPNPTSVHQSAAAQVSRDADNLVFAGIAKTRAEALTLLQIAAIRNHAIYGNNGG